MGTKPFGILVIHSNVKNAVFHIIQSQVALFVNIPCAQVTGEHGYIGNAGSRVFLSAKPNIVIIIKVNTVNHVHR